MSSLGDSVFMEHLAELREAIEAAHKNIAEYMQSRRESTRRSVVSALKAARDLHDLVYFEVESAASGELRREREKLVAAAFAELVATEKVWRNSVSFVEREELLGSGRDRAGSLDSSTTTQRQAMMDATKQMEEDTQLLRDAIATLERAKQTGTASLAELQAQREKMLAVRARLARTNDHLDESSHWIRRIDRALTWWWPS